MSNFTGLQVKLRGDGKRYRLNLRTDRNFDGITNRSDFKTEADIWESLDFPFSETLPRYHGEILKNRASIDPSKIQTIGFLISDKQAGAFCLEIETIEAYQEGGSE